MKSMRITAALGITLATFCVDTSVFAATEVSNYRFRGENTMFNYFVSDPSCPYAAGTSVYVYYFKETSRNSQSSVGTDQNGYSSIIFSYFKYNTCTGEYKNAFAYLDNTDDLKVNLNLQFATIVGTAPVYEYSNQNPYGILKNVPVNITLTGTGDSVTGRTQEMYQFPNSMIKSTSNGTSRSAVGTGIILLDGLNLLGQQSDYSSAYLSNSQGGTLSLVRNTR